MNPVSLKLLAAEGLLALALASGFLMASLGRPLNTPAFTAHKLLAVAGMVLVVLAALALRRAGELPTGQVWVLLLAVLLLVGVTVSGALLSFDRFAVPWLVSTHTFLAIVTLLLAVLVAILRAGDTSPIG